MSLVFWLFVCSGKIKTEQKISILPNDLWMSFLEELNRKRKALNETETVVTTAGGMVHKEKRTGAGFTQQDEAVVSTGFILSDKEADPNDPTARTVEVDFHNQLNPTPEELKARLQWKKERMNIGDGFFASPPNPLFRVGVFVLSKEPNEQHYDSFAFLLSQYGFIQQIDHNDIVVEDILSTLDCVIFPGGLIFDVEKSLGKDQIRHW